MTLQRQPFRSGLTARVALTICSEVIRISGIAESAYRRGEYSISTRKAPGRYRMWPVVRTAKRVTIWRDACPLQPGCGCGQSLRAWIGRQSGSAMPVLSSPATALRMSLSDSGEERGHGVGLILEQKETTGSGSGNSWQPMASLWGSRFEPILQPQAGNGLEVSRVVVHQRQVMNERHRCDQEVNPADGNSLLEQLAVNFLKLIRGIPDASLFSCPPGSAPVRGHPPRSNHLPKPGAAEEPFSPWLSVWDGPDRYLNFVSSATQGFPRARWSCREPRRVRPGHDVNLAVGSLESAQISLIPDRSFIAQGRRSRARTRRAPRRISPRLRYTW